MTGVFNLREHVEVRGERITLPQYAGRRNLQIITASDFNGKLRERGCDSSISVQKLCRAAGDEGEVRETLDLLWRKPEDADQVLGGLLAGNEELYRFEEMLEGEGEARISS